MLLNVKEGKELNMCVGEVPVSKKMPPLTCVLLKGFLHEVLLELRDFSVFAKLCILHPPDFSELLFLFCLLVQILPRSGTPHRDPKGRK